jgi:hypothetical protein
MGASSPGAPRPPSPGAPPHATAGGVTGRPVVPPEPASTMLGGSVPGPPETSSVPSMITSPVAMSSTIPVPALVVTVTPTGM